MNTDIISTYFPSSHAIVTALADLSNIIADSAHDIYKDKHSSITVLWEKAQHIRFRLEDFRRRMELKLGFALDGSFVKENINIGQVYVMSRTCYK
jgi:hypothetical protein